MRLSLRKRNEKAPYRMQLHLALTGSPIEGWNCPDRPFFIPMITPSLTRRALIQKGGMLLAGSTCISALAQVQTPATRPAPGGGDGSDNTLPAATGPLVALNRFPRSVQEYYVRRVREVEAAANARRAALRTRADAERYVSDIRARLLKCFGPFPEKSPLNARVTAVHEREGYRIENVIFDSRPGFPVTANLYVPTGRKHPLPGVIEPCGHSQLVGKGADSYQAVVQSLARQGYVALVYDPMGQGERMQHTDEKLRPLFGVGTSEHTYVGVHMTLVGENLPSWFVWDGMRAIDYLLSRPEVDARRIGVTGTSGGGTQSALLCALDPRLAMAAPSCFITTLRRNIENEHSQDPEQWPWRILAEGLDHSDLIAAMAPKPVMLLGQEKDYFDARGFEEAAARLHRLYSLLGAKENFAFTLGPDYHSYPQQNREAMYGWFNRATGVTHGQKEPEVKLEKADVLHCTRSGQVAELKPATEFTLNRAKSQSLRKSRPVLDEAGLRSAVVAALAMPARSAAPDYRILRGEGGPRSYPKKNHAAYVVESEPDIHVLLYRLIDTQLLSRIPRGPERALLYVSHQSADDELRNDPWLKELVAAEPQSAIFACDVRGVGESKPVLTTRLDPARGGADYFHAGLGLMFGYPTPGQRTHDLLRVVDLLRDYGHREVHLVARGWGAIPGAFAALLHDGITQVTLKHAPTSYSDIAEAERFGWPLSSFVPGVLQSFDLPDCYRILARKKLRQIEPASATGVPS